MAGKFLVKTGHCLGGGVDCHDGDIIELTDKDAIKEKLDRGWVVTATPDEVKKYEAAAKAKSKARADNLRAVLKRVESDAVKAESAAKVAKDAASKAKDDDPDKSDLEAEADRLEAAALLALDRVNDARAALDAEE